MTAEGKADCKILQEENQPIVIDMTDEEKALEQKKREEKKAEEEAGYGWYNPVGWGVAVGGLVTGGSN